jgi:transcriptional regulator with XRE-family HTH domain
MTDQRHIPPHEKLQAYLAAHGETRAAFAARSGVSEASLSRLLTRRMRPGIDMAAAIQAATGGFVLATDWAQDSGRTAA